MGYFLFSRGICLAAKRPNYARLTQKRSLALEAQTLPSGTVGLGLGRRRNVFADETAMRYRALTLRLERCRRSLLWRELGAKPDAEQIFQTEDGYVLFSPNGEAVTTLFRQAGAGNAKKVLTLAVAADCPVWYEFTQLFENFNLSQQEYQIDYTIYSDSPYGDGRADGRSAHADHGRRISRPVCFLLRRQSGPAACAPCGLRGCKGPLLPDVTEDGAPARAI